VSGCGLDSTGLRYGPTHVNTTLNLGLQKRRGID